MKCTGIVLIYLAALVGGAYIAFKPTVDSGFARTQTETGDGMLNHYLLEHSWRAVSDRGYCGTLLAPPFYYPTPWVYWYSETLLGAAPVYWGLRLVMDYELAYQWWQIVCTGLNFITFVAVARWLNCSHLLAAFGGFLWASALAHTDQAMHQQLIPRYWMPLAVYHAWHLATEPTLRSLNRTIAALFLQAVTCFYTGWFLAVGLAVFVPAVVVLLPGRWRVWLEFARANWKQAVLVVGGWGIAFAVFFAPYVIANYGRGRVYGECISTIPTLSGWLSGREGSRWHETIKPYRQPATHECYLFSGFGIDLLLIATLGYTLMAYRRPTRGRDLTLVAACLVTAVVWWLLTLRYTDEDSPWWLVRFLPGGQAIRCVSRVWVIVDLLGILAVVVWLNSVLSRIRREWVRAAIVVAIACPVVYEQTGYEPPSFAKDEFYPRVEGYGDKIRGADVGYIIPRHERFALYGDVMGMWAGLTANVPVVNGYSGRSPDDYEPSIDNVEEWLRKWLRGRAHGRVIVFDPDHPDHVLVLWLE